MDTCADSKGCCECGATVVCGQPSQLSLSTECGATVVCGQPSQLSLSTAVDTAAGAASSSAADLVRDAIDGRTLRTRGLVTYRDPAVVAEVLPFLWVGSSAAAKPSAFIPLGVSLLICCAAEHHNPAPVPPHYRCKALAVARCAEGQPTHPDIRGLLDAFETSYQWIEAARLYGERAPEADEVVGRVPYAARTDKLGRRAVDGARRLRQTVASELRAVPQSGLVRRDERVLLWSNAGGSRACALAAAYLVRRWGLGTSAAVAFVYHWRPHPVRRAYVAALETYAAAHSARPVLCAACASSLTGDIEDAADESYSSPPPQQQQQESSSGLVVARSLTPASLGELLVSLDIGATTALDMSYSTLGLEGARVLADWLRTSRAVRRLTIFQAGLCDAGCALLLAALLTPNFSFDDDPAPPPPHNASLRELHLGGQNELGTLTARALQQLIRYNATLATLSLDAMRVTAGDDALGDFLSCLRERAGASALRHLRLNDLSLSAASLAALGGLSRLESLELRRCRISGGDLLSAWQEECWPAMRALDVSENALVDCACLDRLLGAAPRLRRLEASGCGLDWASSPAALAAAMARVAGGSLAHLDLARNLLGPDSCCAALAPALAAGPLNSLAHLDMSACDVRTAGAAALFRALLGHTALRQLLLAENDIHDSCVPALCAFLARCTSLESLDLRFNRLSEDAVAPVVEALQVTSASSTASRIGELSIRVEGNPCGAHGLGLPHLSRSKTTAAHRPRQSNNSVATV